MGSIADKKRADRMARLKSHGDDDCCDLEKIVHGKKDKQLEYDDEECPECTSTELVTNYKRAEIVCGKCGLVVKENIIDQGAEWRSFSGDDPSENKSRVGEPKKRGEKLAGTEIGWQNRDAYGRRLPNKKRNDFYRMRMWQRRTRASNSTERNISIATSELHKICSKLGIPSSLKEEAAVIYRQASKDSLIRGRSIELMAAASLYAACRKHIFPRTLSEIAEVTASNKSHRRAQRKKIGRSYIFLTRKLKFNVDVAKPQDYAKRYCTELGCTEHMIDGVEAILAKSEALGLFSSRSPMGIIAGAIYIASGAEITQEEIATVTGVTQVTIRNRYKEMLRELGIEISYFSDSASNRISERPIDVAETIDTFAIKYRLNPKVTDGIMRLMMHIDSKKVRSTELRALTAACVSYVVDNTNRHNIARENVCRDLGVNSSHLFVKWYNNLAEKGRFGGLDYIIKSANGASLLLLS
jgi:transcription initiation factor TFIIB